MAVSSALRAQDRRSFPEASRRADRRDRRPFAVTVDAVVGGNPVTPSPSRPVSNLHFCASPDREHPPTRDQNARRLDEDAPIASPGLRMK